LVVPAVADSATRPVLNGGGNVVSGPVANRWTQRRRRRPAPDRRAGV